jgi:hypothetical protein
VLGIIHELSRETLVNVVRWHFSESQTGKDAPDRMAAQVKRRAHDFIDRGNDINSPIDLFNAVNNGGAPLTGMSLYYGKSVNPFRTTYKINGINSYSDFVFQGQPILPFIKAFRHYGIGPGKIIQVNRLTSGPRPLLNIEANAGALSSHHNFWLFSHYESEVTENLQVPPEQEDMTNEQIEEEEENIEEDSILPISRSFQCPICAKSFNKYGNLRRHLDLGNHIIKKDKEPTIVKAAKEYKRVLEEMNAQRVFPEPCDGEPILIIEPAEKPTDLKEGFALKVTNVGKRHDNRITARLNEIYKEGEASGTKMNPQQVVQLLKSEINPDGSRKYPNEIMLNWRQIMSYFSRLTQQKRKAKAAAQAASATTSEDVEEIIAEICSKK